MTGRSASTAAPGRFRKVTILGAGALGCWLGARLADQGVSLGAVARGATLAALREHGFRLRTTGADGSTQELRAAVHATDHPAELGPQDLVIVTVKAPAMRAVAQAMGPLLGPGTAVMVAMNGVPWWFLHDFGGPVAGHALASIDPDGAIAQAIAVEHVVGCVVHASCSLDAPGVARHRMGNGLIIGEPAGGISGRAQALARLLQGAGFDVTPSPRIQKDIWYKLWGNMTVNPISALTGATADCLLDDTLVRAFMSRIMLEARDIGARLGIPITESPEDRHAVTRKLGALKPSMLQDVEAGRPLEIDALLTAVRELGALTGVATPDLDALLGLARVHARRLGLYP